MNTKQLSILVIVCLALGGAGLMVRKNQRSEYHAPRGKMGDRLLGDFDVNSVAGIRIRSGTNSPMEILRKDGEWVVPQRGGYPANFQTVGEFVKKLWELKMATPVNVGQSRHGMLELTPELATLVELLDASGKPVKSLLLGKKHTKESGDSSPFGGGAWPDGRYVKVDQTIALVGDPLSNADSKAADWISKDFFKVEKPKSVSVEHSVATNSFKVTRDTEFAEWKLVDAKPDEKLDSSKSSALSSVLSWPSFNDLILDKKAADLGLDKPSVRAEITTTEGFTYVVKVGAPDGENYPVTVEVKGDFVRERKPGSDEKSEDKERLDKEFKEKLSKLDEKLRSEQMLGKWVYQVSKWTVDPILKERHTLLAEKKAESAPSGATPKPGLEGIIQPGPIKDLPPIPPAPLVEPK